MFKKNYSVVVSGEICLYGQLVYLVLTRYVWKSLDCYVYLLQQIAKATKGSKPFHLHLSSPKGMWGELSLYCTLMHDIEVLKQRADEDSFQNLHRTGSSFDNL